MTLHIEMLKANGLAPIASGKKRRVDLDEDEVKKEGSEIEDDDAEIKTLEVNALHLANYLGGIDTPTLMFKKRMSILKARRTHRSGTGKRIKLEPQNQNTFASTEIIDLT
jgi:hypothetical protein